MIDTHTPNEIVSLLNLIDTYKRWEEYQNQGNRKYDYYHPSEWGKCLRLQQYKHYAHKGLIKVEYEGFSSKMLRLFEKGHRMHERWVDYFDNIGILRGRWRCKNYLCYLFKDNGKIDSNIDVNKTLNNHKARIYGNETKCGIFKPDKCICGCSSFDYLEQGVKSDELKIKGNCDVILDFENFDVKKFKDVRNTFNPNFFPSKGEKIVGDMKTIGQASWDYQLMKRGAHKHNLIQITTYVHLLDCSYGVLMYENKNTSELKWYKVSRNDKWWEAIKWQAKTMVEMAKEQRLPPPRPELKSSYDCKNCSFKSVCHKSAIWKDSSLKQKRKSFYKCLL